MFTEPALIQCIPIFPQMTFNKSLELSLLSGFVSEKEVMDERFITRST